MRIVIDTNLIFSLLISKNEKILRIIFDDRFYIASTTHLIVELFKHKEKIARYSRLTESELLELLLKILENVDIVPYRSIPQVFRERAFSILKSCDIKDVPFLALAFAMEAKLWTGDRKLERCLDRQGIDICISVEELVRLEDI